tara:strand:+ start:953 stop:1603 length:651 start_codon:yes stop_codon:yes gene_type:complete
MSQSNGETHSEFYESIKNSFTEVLNTVPHMKAEYPEIEFRFGVIHPTDNFFKADIPKEIFDKVFNIFSQSGEWHKKESMRSTDYFIKDNRLTHCEKGYLYIKKKKLASSNFSNDDCGLDIRLSVASEVPVKIPKKYEKKLPSESECTFVRHKERYTFIYDVWKYDLTILSLSGNPEKKYEIEIEILNPKYTIYKYTIPYLTDMTIKKIKDVMSLIE